MARRTFQAPNLENATPAMLVDESAKLSIIENYAKKMRAVYKTALFARLNFNKDAPIRDQLQCDSEGKHHHEGDKFIGHIEQYGQDRFDTSAFRADHPELFAQYCKGSTITKLTFDLKQGADNPELQKLMDELKAELGLDEP